MRSVPILYIFVLRAEKRYLHFDCDMKIERKIILFQAVSRNFPNLKVYLIGEWSIADCSWSNRPVFVSGKSYKFKLILMM